MIIDLTSEILFRCPCCQKLYCTDQNVFGGASSSQEPVEFDCFSCEQSFFLDPKAPAAGLYATHKKDKFEFDNCQKCGTLRPKKTDECPGCGVIVSKYEDIQKLENSNLYELQKKWEVTLKDFANDEAHQNFIALAQDRMALSYAYKKYFDAKSLLGDDVIIEKYLSQIEQRLSHSLAQKQNEGRQKSLPVYGKDMKKTNFMSTRFLFMVLGFLGLGFFIFNVVRPQFAHINGALVAMVIISVGLWFIAKGETT